MLVLFLARDCHQMMNLHLFHHPVDALVDFAKENNANTIVRGLRAITDFDYELQMAQTNRALYEGADTIFIPTSIEYSFLSSTTVREIASLGGDVSKFVAPYVEEKLKEKYNTK